MTLLMEFKPLMLMLYLYVTFPKFVPRNQLQTGYKNDDRDCREKGNRIMNILQFTYDSQTKICNEL